MQESNMAMDEAIEGGGSFDASGAFLGCDDKHMRGHYGESNEDEHHKSDEMRRHEQEDSPIEASEDENGEDHMRRTDSDDGIARHSLDESDKNKSDAPQHFSTSKDALNEKSDSSINESGGGGGDKGSNDQKSDKLIPSTSGVSSGSPIVGSHNDRMREVADDIEKLIMDDDLSCNENVALLSDTKAHQSSVDESMTDNAGDNALGSTAGVSELSDLWYYRDPQGKVQGPFTATEMLEWYRAGYFDENLYVKRVCDAQFMALGELLKLCSGTVPFVAAPYMPQLLQTNKGNDVVVAQAAPSTKPVINHLSHAALPVQLVPNQPPLENPLLDEPIHHMHTMVGMFVGSQNGSPQKFPQLEQPHLLNQQAMTIKSLTETEPWGLLNSEQQAALIAINSDIDPILKERNKTSLLLKKRNKTDRFIDHSQYALQFRTDDRSVVDDRTADDRRQVPAPVNMIHPASDPVQHMLHTISMQSQSQVPPAVENNPIKSLIMQLSLPKTAPPPNMLPVHHHLQQPSHMQLPHDNRLPPIPQAHNVHGLWEIPLPSSVAPNLHGNLLPNAAHILEQHMHAKAKEAHQLDQWKKLQAPLLHHELQQSMPNKLIPQTEMFKIRNENFQEEHIVPDANKPAVVDKTDMKNSRSDARLNSNQSPILINDSDVRNNNPIVVIKSTTNKSIPATVTGSGSRFSSSTPSAEISSSVTVPVKAATVPVALNNNNTQQHQQQQNGTHDSSQSILTNTSNNNNIRANASVTSGPVANCKATIMAKESPSQQHASAKKKIKEKDQRLAEEKRRQQEEEERQMLEEKKRLELIAAQRKAKLVDQNQAAVSRCDGNSKRNNMAASVAPWSNISDVAMTNVVNSPLNFAEIQKAERERRAESYRMEQSLREQQTQAILEQQQQKDAIPKWKLKPQANQIKSLAEIQAEESKAKQSNIQQISTTNTQMKLQNAKKDEKWSSASQWTMRGDFSWGESVANVASVNGNMILPSANGNPNYFWEDASKPAQPASSIKNQHDRETRPSSIMQQSSAGSIANSSNSKNAQTNKSTALAKTNSSGNVPIANTSSNNAGSSTKKAKGTSSKKTNNVQNEDSNNDDFHNWCTKTLSAKHGDVIDVPTFVSFLRDIESPFEVKDYIRMYLGETKECVEFAKNFLERRSRYKNQQRAANAHIDDMCSPAPAITPAADCQETKGKGKKEKKKSKMMKLDSRILGFSVTSAEDRLNVGARDYARDGP